MSSRIKKSILKLKESSTLVINERSKELTSRGKKVYNFGFGQSPFPVPENIVNELKKIHQIMSKFEPMSYNCLGVPAFQCFVVKDHGLIRN